MFCFPRKFEFKTRISVERKKKQKEKKELKERREGKGERKTYFRKVGMPWHRSPLSASLSRRTSQLNESVGEGRKKEDIFLFSPAVFVSRRAYKREGRGGRERSVATTRPEGRRWPDVKEFEQRNLC